MNITVDNTGHGYIYSNALHLWILVRCSCDQTSPGCNAPKEIKPGATNGRLNMRGRRAPATDNDLLRFERALIAKGEEKIREYKESDHEPDPRLPNRAENHFDQREHYWEMG